MVLRRWEKMENQMWRKVFLVVFLVTKTTTEMNEDFYKIYDNSIFVDQNPIAKVKASSLLFCCQLCSRDSHCRSANYVKRNESCFLLEKTRSNQTEIFLTQSGCQHLEKINVVESSLLGSSWDNAALHCNDLKIRLPSLKSGVYWIDPNGGSHGDAFQVFCDQETEGGGWTLVWSYTFTDYAHFASKGNAVTPRPNWTAASSANTRLSTTAPLDETNYEAMDFAMWSKIGNQTLIKSSINNWVFCDVGEGSIVHYTAGSIPCRVVRNISFICSNIAPTSLSLRDQGPSFDFTDHYYFFDASTKQNWPTHDPCGDKKKDHLTGVENPHGNVYIR